PRQATASYRRASSWATTGSSPAPATRTTVRSDTPHALAAATARSSRESVISACHRVAAMASARSFASTVASSGRPCPLIRIPRWRSSSAFADAQRLLTRSQGRSLGDLGGGQVPLVQRVELVPEAVALGGE